MVKAKKKKLGAPTKPEDEKIVRGRPWTKGQEKMIQGEADARNMDFAEIVREAIDWYFTSKATKRANVDGSKMFDDVMEK